MNLLHYGLQRSGTNFLEATLKRSYRVRFLNSNKNRDAPIQKHFRLYDDKKIVPNTEYSNELSTPDFKSFEGSLEMAPEYYLVISKDPYSWYLSYLEWAKKNNWPEVSHHYIVEYNLFYGRWLEFSQQTNKIIFVKYYDLLNNLDAELNRLESTMDLKPSFTSFFRSRAPKRVSQSRGFSDDKRSYYLEKKYLKKYSSDDLQEINSLIDSTTITGLGYEKNSRE